MGSPYPRSRGIALAATFAALISVIAPLSIPVGPVPITLQSFVVYLAVVLLGPWYGGLSMVIYLALGAIGLPVFANLSFGTAALLGPAGGYLFAFPIAVFLGGLAARRRSGTRRADAVKVTVAIALALVLVFGIGVVWLFESLGRDLAFGLTYGVIPFIPGDILKVLVAIPIAVRLRWSNLQLPVNTGGIMEPRVAPSIVTGPDSVS